MNDNAEYQFIDTNVLIYAHDKSAGEKHHLARTLVEKMWAAGTGCLSIQVLQEFYVVVTQKVAHPLDAGIAAKVIKDLTFWQVFAPNAHDVLRAIDLQQRYTISFWDAMIIWSALQLKCKRVWSEDLSSNQLYEGLPVVNPFENM